MSEAGSQRVTCFAADPHPLFLRGVCDAIAGDPGLRLLGSGDDGDRALASVLGQRPAVAVLEAVMPGASAVAIAAEAARAGTGTRVLCVSSATDGATVQACLAGGVAGYLAKTTHVPAIRGAIAAVAKGEVVLDPSLPIGSMGAPAGETDTESVRVLTAREIEVLGLTADGLSAKEIGVELSLSWTTVRTHLNKVYAKLRVSTQAQAVARGMRLGLID